MKLRRQMPIEAKSIKQAAIVQFVSKYATVGVQLIITAILSRLVTPSEFGLMAIVYVFTAFFQMFTDMGLSVAIVQFQDLKERDYGSLFMFSAIVGLALTALFCCLAVPISLIYGHDELVLLCCCASPSLLFSCLNMVPNGLMLKEKRFVGMGIRLLFSSLISGAIAILLGFLGYGSYALVTQAIISSLLILIWNLVARPVQEINCHFASVLKKVFSYSSNQFGFNCLNYFARNLDNLIIGRTLGSQPLAYYDKAYKLTTFPMTALSSVVASVIQPFMAEHQNNTKLLRECWWKVTRLLSLLGAPIAAIMTCCSQEITLLLYGDQWADSISLLKILSISVYFQIVCNPSGAFYQSAGRTDSMLHAGIINTLLIAFGLFIGLHVGGILGAALGVTLAYCSHFFTMHFFLLRNILHIKSSDLLLFMPEIITALFIVVCIAQGSVFFESMHLVVSLMVKLAIIIVVMMTMYVFTGRLKILKQLLIR